MKIEKLPKPFSRYFHPLPLIICLIALGVSSVTIVALVHHMDVITFISSIDTKKVTVDELRQGKLKKPVILIDVRSPKEYAEDRIGNSLLVPLTEIQTESGANQVRAIAQKSIQVNHTQPTIVLYCTAGLRSIKAYKLLEKTGLNFVVLTGGINAWRQVVPPEQDAKVLRRYLTTTSI